MLKNPKRVKPKNHLIFVRWFFKVYVILSEYDIIAEKKLFINGLSTFSIFQYLLPQKGKLSIKMV